MEIEGRLILDLGEQSGTAKSSGNAWKKHEYVMETPGEYPRKVKFTIFGTDRCDALCPKLRLGEVVRISADLDSREYNGRWYTDVMVFRVSEPMGAAPAAPAAGGYAQPAPADPFAAPAAPFGAAPAAPDFGPTDNSDDLPF